MILDNVAEFKDATCKAVATIANGTALSPAVDLGGTTLVAIHMPATWTAASMTFQASEDNVTFDNLYDSGGTEKTFTVAQARTVLLAPYDFVGFRYLKVRSGTTGAPVNQLQATPVILITRSNLG